jgi:twitching motility protein PilT
VAQQQYVLAPLLHALIQAQGSDLFVRGGSKPKIALPSGVFPCDWPVMTNAECDQAITQTMDDPADRERFRTAYEVDYAFVVEGLGRFRGVAFRTMGAPALVARLLADTPRTLEQLRLPVRLQDLALARSGLIVIGGAPGSGKSNTAAAITEVINETQPVHILTIEDPIEIVYTEKRATITQREVRSDTADWGSGLWSAMRQRPHVIVIGEMRDTETVRTALRAANSGQLVITTVHATTATDTISRLIGFYPPGERDEARRSLADSLRGVIAQRLIPDVDGADVPCVELLMPNPNIRAAINDPENNPSIERLIRDSGHDGSQTFDDHLVQLVRAQRIHISTAKTAGSSTHEISLRLKRAGFPSHLVDAA